MSQSFKLESDEVRLAKVIDIAKQKERDNETFPDGLTPAFESYLTQLVRYATGEDAGFDQAEGLLERAFESWRISAKRAAGESLIHLRMQTAPNWRDRRLVLDIITDDRPFLVDSISGALTEAGKPVSFFLNAVVDIARDTRGNRLAENGEIVRESMIRAEMDPAVNDAEITQLQASLEKVLNNVTLAVDDWEAMRARLAACIAQLERTRPQNIERDDQREAVDFLKWLWDNRFAFLGVRHYRYRPNGEGVEFAHDKDADLGILRDQSLHVLKSTYDEDGHLSPAVEDFMKSHEPILVAKANVKSVVHRRAYMDYIGVKSYSLNGEVTGEERFVGLFTADAYNRPASDIPLIRAKLRKVLEHIEFPPGSHNEKALVNILETYPRDDIFQVDVETLALTSHGILRLYKRPRVSLFLRRDRFDRFISALVFIPRDRFNSDVREKIGAHLAQTFQGRVSAFYPSFDDATLVRVHFIIGIDQGAPQGPGAETLTEEISVICREWRDNLLEAIHTHEDTPPHLYERYENAFDAAYREVTSGAEALEDIAVIETLDRNPLQPRAYRLPSDSKSQIRLKLYSANGPMKLSDLIPTIENLGLNVAQEAGGAIRPTNHPAGENIWLHNFFAEEPHGRAIDVMGVKPLLEDAIDAVLEGSCEDDAFNALVTLAGLHWREVSMLRAAAKHHMQAGFQFSQNYIAEVLAKHPTIVKGLVDVFHARFNPAGPSDLEYRRKEVDGACATVTSALEEVSSLDEDRILRRFLNLFEAMTRTNYYQLNANGAHKPYISFKLDSNALAELPDPKPYREIFVSGPRVDGVHLRFGPVSRGGLRWSDRREDFRTEVLGLVKAQRVKNAVIVPSGSKGCFYPKQLPVDGDRNAVYEEGRAAYKVFISGMLDLTDNIVDGAITPPQNVIRWDGDDPYLVVAADKGTAQFSDTANEISTQYGFWLGDAFASGGSAGYDHKAMGITARGGWEAVKRHFREMGKDIQTQPFTVAGVGDMSGDVFGNGMLLSEQIKLIAAFDHRDIFIDPEPDPAISFQERKRLFETPRSSWQDYNAKLISKGGGVFSRSAKSIDLTPEIKRLLNFEKDKATPNELIKAILKAEMELFWLGGIGTYFKASDEDHWRVGDRNNDAVRVDIEEVRAKVIGEGANLGLTQDARIAFAQMGGRINTDAIDNSAGVDSSDHEVNIKILLANAIEKGALSQEERNPLLSDMTDDVADHVLIHNYRQTGALSLREAEAVENLQAHARFMLDMEKNGRLDRALERLPDAEEIEKRAADNAGLTRPELATLMAYAKNWLFEELTTSQTPDDPAFESELYAYFPQKLHQFNEAITSHRLRREIIATRLSNEVIEKCGSSFLFRVSETTGAALADIALAYEGAKRVLKLKDYTQAIDDLDNKANADVQTGLHMAASSLLRELMYRLISGVKTSTLLAEHGVQGVTAEYENEIEELESHLASILPDGPRQRLTERRAEWLARGATERLANSAALMPAMENSLDIINLSKDTGWAIKDAGAAFFFIGDQLKIDSVRHTAKHARRSDYYEKTAVRRLLEDLRMRQFALSGHMIAQSGVAPQGEPETWLSELYQNWIAARPEVFSSVERFVIELDINANASVAKLSLLNRKLADLEERLQMAIVHSE